MEFFAFSSPSPRTHTRLMKRRIPLVAGLLMLLAACAAPQKSSEKGLTGHWTNSLGTVWSVKPDGKFDVDLNQDGKADAWGHYQITGDTVRIFDTSGKHAKGCEGEAVYHFHVTGNTLHFTLVKDSCKLRKKNILSDWHRTSRFNVPHFSA